MDSGKGASALRMAGLVEGHSRVAFVKYAFLTALRRAFRCLGHWVGGRPVFNIVVTLSLAALAATGLYGARSAHRAQDGYTPLDAPSIGERAIYSQFFYGSQDPDEQPVRTVVLIHARDNGSVLRPEYFDRVAHISHYVSTGLNVTVAGNRTYKFTDFCGYLCPLNDIVQSFKGALAERRPNTQLAYPRSTVDGQPIDISTHFFGVAQSDDRTQYNRLRHVSLVALYFRLFVPDHLSHVISAEWERKLYRWVYFDYDDPLVEVAVMGDRMIMDEVQRAELSVVSHFAAGFCLLLAFILLTGAIGAFYHNEASFTRLLLGWAALLSPILASVAAFGLCSWFQFRLYPMVVLAPLLITAIGVDDAFLMMHAWHRVRSANGPVPQRLAAVFEDVGPSISITSLTNTLAFGIGATTNTPVIQVFCLIVALAMAIDFVFEILFFGSVLALVGRCEARAARRRSDEGDAPPPPAAKECSLSACRFKCDQRVGDEVTGGGGLHCVGECGRKPLEGTLSAVRRRLRELLSAGLDTYAMLLTNKFCLAGILAFGLVCWTFAILGALGIETVVNIRKILPADSRMFLADDLLEQYVWTEYYPTTLIVNNSPDLTNGTELRNVHAMVSAFESAPDALGPDHTSFWARTYEKLQEAGDYFLHFVGFLADEYDDDEAADDGGLKLDGVRQFLADNAYYKNDVKLVEGADGTTRVRSFAFHVASENANSWHKRVSMLRAWRRLAQRYAQYNVTVHTTNALICDAIGNLKGVTVQSVAVTLVCMAAVCALFIPSLAGVAAAALAIASTSLGVFGSLSWLGMDLDPITMAAILMAIGFSVDYTAHTSYHYHKGQLAHLVHDTPGELVLGMGRYGRVGVRCRRMRVAETLHSVAWPMFQAGASTMCCVAPLYWHDDYGPSVFVRTICLLVLWGWLHGLVLLPALLAALPDCCLVPPPGPRPAGGDAEHGAPLDHAHSVHIGGATTPAANAVWCKLGAKCADCVRDNSYAMLPVAGAEQSASPLLPAAGQSTTTAAVAVGDRGAVADDDDDDDAASSSDAFDTVHIGAKEKLNDESSGSGLVVVSHS